ncbi:hypothetical protein CRG98_003695 [Punica granatum]|uniref:Uncharacterized protein n=1 Tax=Punica granatum TaxID=22663 RepID=A0A2I0L5D9_PUNGR|nr:hypothetical protein CRG98_003695 [Punica granatum]
MKNSPANHNLRGSLSKLAPSCRDAVRSSLERTPPWRGLGRGLEEAHTWTRQSQAKNDTQVHISLRIPLGPFPHTSTREVSDEYVPPMKPKTETIEQTIQPRRVRLHRDRATFRGKLGLPHCTEPSPTTYNDKSWGRTHSASRVPIIQGAPSTGAIMHDQEWRLHKTPDTDHKDRGIPIQHSREATSITHTPGPPYGTLMRRVISSRTPDRAAWAPLRTSRYAHARPMEPRRPRIVASESGTPIRITKAKTLHGSPRRPETEEHASQTLSFTYAYKSFIIP